MTIAEMLLPEFDREVAATRKTLERVPDDRFDWRPHAKSTTMGGLTTHLSNILSWAVHAVEKDSIDIAPGGVPVRAEPVRSAAEAVEVFDRNAAAARSAIAGADDAHMAGTWTLFANGNRIFSQPRAGVLRGMVMNHMIHHRAQLGVYLRLNDVPVPSVYGPSADESTF
ncbi:MAG TPA: DinB family protein [Pyrinomonadaceae bacterium]|jgi:uncharacterized damage-inducible protein DinB|nr:DinB family protein [Pyrinomonadaceae bacterium]